jgi:hypothetical protein
VFRDITKIVTTINSISKNINTQKIYLQASDSEYPNIYKEHLEFIYKKIKESPVILTPKQSQSYISWEDLITIRDNFEQELQTSDRIRTTKYQKKQPYKQLLLISLYTYVSPRRIADFLYMNCYIDRPETVDTTMNYYIQSEKKFIFNNIQRMQ